MSEETKPSHPEVREAAAAYTIGPASLSAPMPKISAGELAEYRMTARRLQKREQANLEKRRAHAWKAAHYAATLLREHFGATRVIVFGSLIHNESFTPWSDVDIAAWGIAPRDTFWAIGAVLDSDAEIEVNLIDVNACRPEILAVIEREGVDL